MRQLMISLDKKILDPTSAVARRMVEYGKNSELYIVIPNAQKIGLDLSPTVHVYGSGGNSKVSQFLKTCKTARRLVPQFKISSVTTQDPFFTGLLGLRAVHKFKIPLEVQIHGDFFGSNYYRFKSGPLNHLRWHIGNCVVRHADTIRVVGERIQKSLIERLKIDPKKITIRSVPIDYIPLQENAVSKSLRATYPGFKKIFVFLGRFDKVKNIPWLIDVFSQVAQNNPEMLLLIVGDGVLREKINKKIQNIKLPNKNIRLEPWSVIPLAYYVTSDCILFPSLSEGYGLVPMEANALGKPVIMNDVGVANYELKPSDKVTILPINDKEKWIQAILKV